MLRDLLCAFGLACAPEVSAHKLLDMLVSSRAVPEVMQPQLDALYGTIKLNWEDADNSDGDIQFWFDLTPDGFLPSWITCRVSDQPITQDNMQGLPGAELLFQLMADPAPEDVRYRAFGWVQYLDSILRAKAFLDQSEIWAQTHVGPVYLKQPDIRNETARRTAPPLLAYFSMYVDYDDTKGVARAGLLMDVR